MYGIDLRVLEQFLEVLIATIHLPIVATLLQLAGIALADGIAIRVRMLLPDWDELSPKSEADDCDVEFAMAHESEKFGKTTKTLRALRNRHNIADMMCGRTPQDCPPEPS